MSKINELIQTLCPDGVEYKSLKDLYEYRRGSFPQPYTNMSFYGGDNAAPFVQVADVCDDGFCLVDKTKQTISKIAQPKSIFVKKGTVIVTLQGTIGRVAITQYDAYVDRTLAIFTKCKVSDLNKRYFSYCLKSIFDEKKKLARGSTIKSITKEEFSEFEIPVPPRPVQDEIVRILDEYTDLEAELEAKLSEEIELKQKQYEYCASKLFEDLNVEYISMSELAKFKYGYTDKASDSGNARFIRITDIDDFGELSSADEKYIMLTDDSEKYLLTKGSLVVARTGATYGKTLYFDSDEPSVYASFLIKIDFDNNQVLNRYYWHFTKTSLYWEQANKYVKVGGQQQFNSPALGRVCVPVPSITEQERIVKTLDKYDTYTRDMISALNTELESRKKQYAYYRDQLLTFKRKE